MRTTTLAMACLLALSACGGGTEATADAGPTMAADAAGPAVDGAAPADAAAATDATIGFDIANLPISDVALGEFPYLRLPDGYVHDTREGSDHDRVAFWTGDRLEWVEGRVFGSAVRGDEDQGQTFALLEFQRNMQEAIRQAGGQRIARGEWPREARDELKATDDDIGVRYNAGLGDIWSRPVETFVIRRPDRAIWIQMTGYTHGGNLLVAETRPVEITAGLLEADVLKAQLDADGKVAITVNFATDSADILPDSQPQIDRVVALLKADDALRLAVEGHTDDSGDAARNRTLSQARANAVVAALVAAGINGARLSAAGFGQDRPVADNAGAEGKARNRRVELVKR